MNIFVARLDPQTTGESLQELFEQYGEVVSSKVIFDRESGRSKCFGFVEMADDSAGNEAINALNDSDFEGSSIAVKVARPKEEGSGRRGGFSRDQGRDRGGFNRDRSRDNRRY